MSVGLGGATGAIQAAGKVGAAAGSSAVTVTESAALSHDSHRGRAGLPACTSGKSQANFAYFLLVPVGESVSLEFDYSGAFCASGGPPERPSSCRRSVSPLAHGIITK